eukprot:73474-Pelagomonas_calceolata.AAC.1
MLRALGPAAFRKPLLAHTNRHAAATAARCCVSLSQPDKSCQLFKMISTKRDHEVILKAGAM